jgi:hypothetical protein
MMNKALLSVVAVLVVSLVTGIHVAQAVPKPFIPEFTLKIVDNSYDMPPTYSIDPYTGENVSHVGNHVSNKSIEVAIKKQPFTSFNDTDGNLIKLSYTIRVKGHFEEDWQVFGIGRQDSSIPEYEIWSYITGLDADYLLLREIPYGGKLDFEVQASIGYSIRVSDPERSGLYNMYYPVIKFVGEESGWSNPQTLTFPSAPYNSLPPTFSPSPSATQQTQAEPTQTNPLSYVFIVFSVAIISFVAGALIVKLRCKKSSVEESV